MKSNVTGVYEVVYLMDSSMLSEKDRNEIHRQNVLASSADKAIEKANEELKGAYSTPIFISVNLVAEIFGHAENPRVNKNKAGVE
jgi:hypothetical protein